MPMIRRSPRARSGITLTEILISIMIMGIGMISLAVLFPLGLLRLQAAARLSRGTYLTESAIQDLSTRNLLSAQSFLVTGLYVDANGNPVNPWVNDTTNFAGGIVRTVGRGLPAAYDPLWRCQTNAVGGGYYSFAAGSDARFGSGAGFVGAQSGDGGTPSAYGLQRLTNFAFGASNVVQDIFVSPEDIVFENPEDVGQAGQNTSSVVPNLSFNGLPVNDWHYTWLFTGQQSSANNTSVFDGDIVICENREFNIESVTGPVSQTSVMQVAGELVVEGIFGYGQTVATSSAQSSPKTEGFCFAANRTVVLRWPATMDDPTVKAGSFIADVTYERSAAAEQTKMYGPGTGLMTQWPQNAGAIPAVTVPPLQRCYWYQVAKTSPAGPDVLNNSGYRSMTVWTTTPLRAQTLLTVPSGNGVAMPVFANAALIMPSVVNVYARTIYAH
jgi:type II secretory pathway pseudopilin PulG